MAAPAKTVLVTRSAINADAMAWQAKPQQDSGLFAVDIRPLLKSEKIALGRFVVMPIDGLCVSTQSSQDGLLLLQISGGSAGIYRLQFVFSDTGGNIDVFQVALPVTGTANCAVSPSVGRAVRGPPGPAGPPGSPGRIGPPGIIDGSKVQRLPGAIAPNDELLLYRPGDGFYYVSASLLLPGAIVFDADIATFGGTSLTYGAAPALGAVTFDGQTVTSGSVATTFGTVPITAPVVFKSDAAVFAGQATTFGTVADGTSPVQFAGQDVVVASQPARYGTPSTAVDYAGQPLTASGQPAQFSGTAAPPVATTALREFVFAQPAPTTTWTINHNLSLHPAVRPVNPDGNLVDSDVLYLDEHTVVLTFSAPFAGIAYLS